MSVKTRTWLARDMAGKLRIGLATTLRRDGAKTSYHPVPEEKRPVHQRFKGRHVAASL